MKLRAATDDRHCQGIMGSQLKSKEATVKYHSFLKSF